MTIISNPQHKRDIVHLFVTGSTVSAIATQNTVSRVAIENVLREAISGLSALVSERAKKATAQVNTSADSIILTTEGAHGSN